MSFKKKQKIKLNKNLILKDEIEKKKKQRVN